MRSEHIFLRVGDSAVRFCSAAYTIALVARREGDGELCRMALHLRFPSSLLPVLDVPSAGRPHRLFAQPIDEGNHVHRMMFVLKIPRFAALSYSAEHYFVYRAFDTGYFCTHGVDCSEADTSNCSAYSTSRLDCTTCHVALRTPR